MARGWIDHQALAIMQGLPPVPGDTRTGENPIQIVNLISLASGIALADWTPQIPTLEQGGVWSDSPLSVGRRLLVGNDGNVTEKMQLTITADSLTTMLKLRAIINTMILNARAFWTDNAQIDPVYLKWWVVNAPGPQYALIFNMDVVYDDGDSPTPSSTATLTIEREPYWRGVAPGANPKQWYWEFYKQPFNISNATIAVQVNQMVETTFNNRSEFNDVNYLALKSDNAVTIPANLIPGDAPALILFDAGTAAAAAPFVMVGKRTTKVGTYNATNAIIQNSILNGSDATLGVDATKVNDTGASKAAGSGTAQRVRVSFATATDQLRLTFPTLGKNRYVGRYMAFLRCRQINGAAGDITMYLRYGEEVTATTDGIKLNVVNPQLIAGVGDTTYWGLTYMGVMVFPLDSRKAVVNSANGITTGLGINTTNNNVTIALFASKVAGTQELFVNDLVMIPIDEGSFTLESTSTNLKDGMQFDNTGYYAHGLLDPIAVNVSQVGTGNTQDAKLTGTGIELTPGVENRLYCLTYDANLQSRADLNFLCSVNIIPRWRGIRDR